MGTIHFNTNTRILSNMRLHSHIIAVYFLLSTPQRVTSSVRDDKWLLSHVFLHQNLPLCSQVALTSGYLTPCHVRSAEDEAALPCLVNKHCGDYVAPPLDISCSDGTLNKTCMPRSISPNMMFCACNAQKSADYHGDDMTWTGWWSSLASPYTGLYREMCDTTSGECLAKEYRLEQTYLAKHLDLQPSAFTASSVYASGYDAYKARADIEDPPCAWVSAVTSSSWVQFDLGSPYSVLGILVAKRCDSLAHYLVSFTLIGSDDGSAWTTPGDAIYVNYNDNQNGTHWFDAPLPSRRLWRITVVEKTSGYKPSAKADLIGYIKD